MKARLAKGPDWEVMSAWLAGGMALKSSAFSFVLPPSGEGSFSWCWWRGGCFGLAGGDGSPCGRFPSCCGYGSRSVRCGLERRRCLRVVELFKDLVGELGQVGLEDRESVGP